MNEQPQSPRMNEQLVRSVLQRVDEHVSSPEMHVDDELLVLFSQGALTGTERETVIAHLAECPACRKTASLLGTMVGEEAQIVTQPKMPRWTKRVLFLASLAAGVIVLVSVVLTLPDQQPRQRLTEADVYRQVEQQLVAGNFAKARELLTAANERGIDSDRLQGLSSQAIREIPGQYALAFLGRLSDFGFAIGGIVARGPADQGKQAANAHAAELLDSADSNDPTLLLNRGHVRLSRGETEAALQDFQAVLDNSPDEPLAWLGKGLAEFLLDDFVAAQDSFERCLRIDPAIRAARMNLAMTLEEQGQLTQALQQWNNFLRDDGITTQERRAVRDRITEIEEALQ